MLRSVLRGSRQVRLKSIGAHTSSSSNVAPRNHGSRQKTNWWAVISEWRTVGTLSIGIISWYINAREERRQNVKSAKLDLVTKQVRELYGPLYGNRIVAETSYRSVMKEHGGLRHYLREAKDRKDAEMIKAWRSYVCNVLYPLDMEAREMICSYAHLIADTEFPEEFERFLSHTAKMQFVMESWKNDMGQLRSTTEFTEEDFLECNNSSGIGGSKNVITHLRDRCRQLRKKQRHFAEGANVDNSEFVTLFEKAFK